MKISVIVPIYKVEDYIRRCVDSLLKQTFSDFELILVEDGSPDECPHICDEYAMKDKRVKVVHKINGGLSDARNAGLNIMTGEYVAFVDADDWVAPDYLEKLLDGITLTDADICECNIIRTTGNDILPKTDNEKINSYSSTEAIKLLIEENVFHQYVWNKLYRASIVKDVFFPKNKLNEDEFWTYQIFGKAKKIASINAVLYYYYQRADSIMGSGYNIRRLDAIEAKVLRQEYIDLNFPEIKEIAKKNLFESCIYAGQMSLLNLHKKEKEEAKVKLDSLVKKCSISLRECLMTNGGNKLWFTLAYFSFWGTCILKNIMKKGF